MKPINDYIVERIRIDNISMYTLPENLKRKYNLIYNPTTGKYDCNGDIRIDDDLIENGQFKCKFGVVKGYFNCSYLSSLKTLKGSPEKVGGDFSCSWCESLTSLEGVPKEVGGSFYCYHCKSLESLEGVPKEIGGGFYCSYCKSLKTLMGAPKEVGGDFYCNNCKSLTSLEGAPEKVGCDFNCEYCPKLKDHNIKTKIGGEFIK